MGVSTEIYLMALNYEEHGVYPYFVQPPAFILNMTDEHSQTNDVY